MRDFRRVADAVAAQIAAGRLRAGDRLPTQRAFARRHGIADSTAGRVYAELVRRGLVVGEVGRGTFVRAAAPVEGPALAEPARQRVDLELNYPEVPGQSELLAAGLARMSRPDVLAAALGPAGARGTGAARDAVATLLADPRWRPAADDVLFAGSGRQVIAGALAALVPVGGRLGVEEFTYPVVKALAARLGRTAVPLACDEEGLRPGALLAAHREGPLHAVYVQPTLHNPLSLTMSDRRRADLAEALRRTGTVAVEDAIWAFLRPDAPPPLAAYAPERVVLADSLSKRLAPGLTAGFAIAPAGLAEPVATALRSGGWGVTGYALEAMTGWVGDGTVARLCAAKREEAALRQALAAEVLRGFALRTDPHSCFCWWDLPEPWRADTFVAAAGRRGIAVTPAASFAAGSRRAPDAVRIGLASPPRDVLRGALATLAALARTLPDDTGPE
ncbi:DNA-binding transcriptional regulator, MocR family, contains an aminotransferase domain [Actinacidiphila yanglinensis]|uniref:DNA-binding transcriptional regulator, MocR family, contains an aminotransferase domain n=1 Tax=Actinacidiphila yanglinensis TaxID=310779 RepID=A0A1H6DXI1_9ACTN|nr:PLP-dependent aminotransferase family protein [Actinacidiphila yanglinensis]SEG90060.1 DNA-binding transcriptional regulator, MocR family, contains an aminotransferase domain [Actinacidiphila yanglinensis]